MPNNPKNRAFKTRLYLIRFCRDNNPSFQFATQTEHEILMELPCTKAELRSLKLHETICCTIYKDLYANISRTY